MARLTERELLFRHCSSKLANYLLLNNRNLHSITIATSCEYRDVQPSLQATNGIPGLHLESEPIFDCFYEYFHCCIKWKTIYRERFGREGWPRKGQLRLANNGFFLGPSGRVVVRIASLPGITFRNNPGRPFS